MSCHNLSGHPLGQINPAVHCVLQIILGTLKGANIHYFSEIIILVLG